MYNYIVKTLTLYKPSYKYQPLGCCFNYGDKVWEYYDENLKSSLDRLVDYMNTNFEYINWSYPSNELQYKFINYSVVADLNDRCVVITAERWERKRVGTRTVHIIAQDGKEYYREEPNEPEPYTESYEESGDGDKVQVYEIIKVYVEEYKINIY